MQLHNNNLQLLREQLNIEVFKYNINDCIIGVQPVTLSNEEQSLIYCIQTLTQTKCNQLNISDFQTKGINYMINFIATN